MYQLLTHGGGTGNVADNILNAMFRLLLRVERWKSHASSVVGTEHDRFNLANTVYLTCWDKIRKEVAASARLLRPTGTTTIGDTLVALLAGKPAPPSPRLWESTCFCYRYKRHPPSHQESDQPAGSIAVGGCLGTRARGGLYGSVFDSRMKRILETAGVRIIPLDGPMNFGNRTTFASCFPVTAAILGPIRREAR
ncbi:hypothetical protein JQK88_33350 [Mesorhizobium caraganae]|uniref:acyl-homoserine-lactone synthase n=1 Tax=Mesorhizobium caraganae TaxID=483206 RepID=UPI001939CDA7|nr:acyl-homoserine-lactone synthase [Mesorhizobium caraganae]MBM2715992.1 hypothetical protein [Mesorhizobium caraganae]